MSDASKAMSDLQYRIAYHMDELAKMAEDIHDETYAAQGLGVWHVDIMKAGDDLRAAIISIGSAAGRLHTLSDAVKRLDKKWADRAASIAQLQPEVLDGTADSDDTF